MIKPGYYQLNDKDDLFSLFEKGLLTTEEARGFYKGNIFKYVTRYQDKNGIKDLEKAQTYLDQLTNFEHDLYKDEKETINKTLKQNNGSGITFFN